MIPVLIVGGGPVGLSLAIDLGWRGIECVLVERRDGRLAVPKMSQVSTRNMEFCRRWGIAGRVKDAVRDHGKSLDFVYLTSLTGQQLAHVEVLPEARRGALDYTPEGPCPCAQIFFDPILADHAASLPGVTLRYETTLDDFEQGDGFVRARVVETGNGRAETIEARYLVGCDGANGIVRRALGIGLEGRGLVANSINIFFRAPDMTAFHDKGWARFYRTIDETGCWGELIAIDGRELWRLTVFHESDAEADADAYLRRMAGTDFPYEIISVLPWERRDVVADRYRDGNVFLAGDAAHECSPTGGLGMHTGVGEAVNLGWKLAAVLDGWGGPALLDSYEAECRPIARRNVALATSAYDHITGLPPCDTAGDPATTAAHWRAAFEAAEAEFDKLTVSEQAKTQYRYAGSPVCVPDDAALPPDDTGRFVQSAIPGMRAPHAWLADGRSTLDLFGRGFTLLRLGPAPPDAAPLLEAAAARGVPLEVADVEDDRIVGLYERSLVLVRPDGHVAWRGDAFPADTDALIDCARGG